MTTLSAVRLELKSLGTDHATVLTSLIGKGKVGSFKCKAGSPQRHGFGPSDDSYPRLGKQISPFDPATLPSLAKLQALCLRELPEAREYFGDRLSYCAPTVEGEKTDIASDRDPDPSLQLIKSLTDPGIITTNAVASFPSESLDQLCIGGPQEISEDALHTSITSCTIISRDTIVPLQHNSEGVTVTTALSGAILWIIWPPTDHNLNILQAANTKFAQEFDEAELDVAHQLVGGVILKQAEGEGLRIPPFCPMMGLVLQTSVFARYTTTTVEQFVAMLRKLLFLDAFFATELDGARKKTTFVQQSLMWLDRLLNGEMIHIDTDNEEFDATYKLAYLENGPLDTLLRSWDDVKDNLHALLTEADQHVLCGIWVNFLTQCDGRKCNICGVRVSHKGQFMKEHFLKMHWPKTEESTDRVDSIDVCEDHEETRVGRLIMNISEEVNGEVNVSI